MRPLATPETIFFRMSSWEKSFERFYFNHTIWIYRWLFVYKISILALWESCKEAVFSRVRIQYLHSVGMLIEVILDMWPRNGSITKGLLK